VTTGRKATIFMFCRRRGIHACRRETRQATSGLLLLTNDSALSSFLTDLTHKVMRTYPVSGEGESLSPPEAVGWSWWRAPQCHTVKIQRVPDANHI
jgi:hypothetical protein